MGKGWKLLICAVEKSPLATERTLCKPSIPLWSQSQVPSQILHPTYTSYSHSIMPFPSQTSPGSAMLMFWDEACKKGNPLFVHTNLRICAKSNHFCSTWFRGKSQRYLSSPTSIAYHVEHVHGTQTSLVHTCIFFLLANCDVGYRRRHTTDRTSMSSQTQCSSNDPLWTFSCQSWCL